MTENLGELICFTVTDTFGSLIKGRSFWWIVSEASDAVRRSAWMSCTRGSEILPSGRTMTSMVISLSPQTETFSTSSGPIRYCEEADDPAFPAPDDCVCIAGGIFAALACLETAFSRVSGFSDGGTAVDAGAGGIGFISVLASETGGSTAAAVEEEATLSGVAGFFPGTFGVTESRDDRYRSADA